MHASQFHWMVPLPQFMTPSGSYQRTLDVVRWVGEIRPASKNLEGKFRLCQYREICGGSRALSFAMKRDSFPEEPCCVHEPKREVNPHEKANQSLCEG